MRAKVPRLAIFNTQSENSEFTVHSSKNHNCYMGSSIVNSEDTHYSDWAFNCRDCMDLLFCNRLEMCYQCFASQDCFHSNYLELCSNVTESFFAFDCRGSKRLVGCVSLRNRKNHILNQPASKEECFSVIKRLKTDRTFFLEFKKQFEALKAGMSKRDTWMINSENCTGDYIVNSKNAQFAFAVEDAEDARYLYESEKIKDAYDVTRVGQGEMLYEVTAGVDLKFAKFCNLTYHSDNMAYCDNCQNSSTCFGCVGLKNHQYCFLNKQYTKEEYVQLIPKVIEYMKSTGEYGEFFPFSFSPFGYNETKAQEFFPMTRDQVLARGWTWCDYELSASPALKQIPAQRIPDNISGVPDDILHWAVTCEVTGKPFKITPQELKFYRLKGLPIPHRCPRQRHLERTALQNPRHLYSRQCAKCQSAIQTTYAPDRPEKVLCGECYLSEVY
ncbi:hypothetical protein COY07_02055 [Candidatus Peregrinibacteria bacterium CG_4_10_14_0_2_um_filter_43_11]|nr:MAG: hypothetical protein COY07_02055 [Candidatus Peregrinibacteria bacterium CG_4_10_14_0_2_um_filter_43_11]